MLDISSEQAILIEISLEKHLPELNDREKEMMAPVFDQLTAIIEDPTKSAPPPPAKPEARRKGKNVNPTLGRGALTIAGGLHLEPSALGAAG